MLPGFGDGFVSTVEEGFDVEHGEGTLLGFGEGSDTEGEGIEFGGEGKASIGSLCS